jgi:Fe-S-cluster containining protein
VKKENNSAELLALSKAIAYKGKTGKKRENFCAQYISRKKEVLRQFHEVQTKAVKEAGQSITCRKACQYSSCCMEYVDATPGECEAIAYYLYHHESAIYSFLKKYKKWIEKTGEIQDSMNVLEEMSFNFSEHHDKQTVGPEIKKYRENKNTCPFLEDNLCSIYEVRPYSCAGYYVVSSLALCAPDYPGEIPPVNNFIPMDEITDVSFYYQSLERPVLLCMQKAVYEILEKGYIYLSGIPGLKSIEEEALSDKKVKLKYRNYLGDR